MKTGLRYAVIGLVAVLVIYLLFTQVFPWVDSRFVTDPVLNG